MERKDSTLGMPSESNPFLCGLPPFLLVLSKVVSLWLDELVSLRSTAPRPADGLVAVSDSASSLAM